MRHIYRYILAPLAAVLAMGAVGASAALAAPEWYSSATKPALEWWQGSEISTAVATKSKGTVILEDRGEGASGVSLAVICESSGEGSAGTGTAGTGTSWSLSSCAPTAKPSTRKAKK